MAKTIDKIKKLLALSKSSNENEAAAALARAMRLCAENNICIDDFDSESIGDEIETQGVIDEKSNIPRWERKFAAGLAAVFGCRTIINDRCFWEDHKEKQRRSIAVVGFASDVEIFKYIHAYLIRQIKDMTTKHLRRRKYSFNETSEKERYRRSYALGLSESVIRKAKEFFNRDNTEAETAGYALVLKRGGLVDKHLDGLGFENVKNRPMQLDFNGYDKGYEDGDKISLRHGMNKAKPQRAGLITG
jgi:hypothetical protein